jgi:hypothetical protein
MPEYTGIVAQMGTDGTVANQLHSEAVEAAADYATAAAATAVVVTYAAAVALRHVITGVSVSYSAAPTGGKLTITDAGVTIFEVDILLGGPTTIHFFTPKKQAAVNTALVVTLASGAGAVVGKVNVLGHWTEA